MTATVDRIQTRRLENAFEAGVTKHPRSQQPKASPNTHGNAGETVTKHPRDCCRTSHRMVRTAPLYTEEMVRAVVAPQMGE
jgi:hypothetical protein